MATLPSILDGYVMVLILYLVGNGLLFFPVRKRLRVPWWVIGLLTLVEAVCVYQFLHVLWMGNIAVVFLFFLLFVRITDVEPYKLMYLNMIAVGYTTACNLVFYMIWGPSYVWGWREIVWMVLAYAATAPLVAFGLCRAVWPRLSQLDMSRSSWLWIMPAFAIVIMLLVGSGHIQFLMTDYERVYGLTSLLVVVLSMGVSLLLLEITRRNRLALDHQHDIAIVEVQIASQSRRHIELMQHMDEVRIMRHDLRHHARIATMLLNEGNLDALRAYLGEMERDSRLHGNIIYSQNHISDLVAHYAVQVGRDAQIRVIIQCGLPKAFWVSDGDLSILLGNLMENALHACRLQTEGQREIILTTAVRGEEAYVDVENSCGDPLSDTAAHRKKASIPGSTGYGIPSVRNIAEKYHGAASFEKREGRYQASVLLYKPRDADRSPSEGCQAVGNWR